MLLVHFYEDGIAERQFLLESSFLSSSAVGYLNLSSSVYFWSLMDVMMFE